jgi:hypothetical protein
MFQDAMAAGTKIIDVGPLATPLARQADIHLRIRPGTPERLPSAWRMSSSKKASMTVSS